MVIKKWVHLVVFLGAAWSPAQAPEPDSGGAVPKQNDPDQYTKRIQLLGWVGAQFQDTDREGIESFADISTAYLGLHINMAPSWRAFAEIEYEHVPNIDDTPTETEIILERAYLEYNRSHAVKLRLGRFNTPAGIWKPLHWDVSVDTIALPIMEDNGYLPIKSTGLEFLGTRFTTQSEWNYAFLASGVSEDAPTNQTLDEARAVGGDLNFFYHERFLLGTSYYTYRGQGNRKISVNGLQPYMDLYLVPGRLLWRTEFLTLKRRDAPDVTTYYSKLKWQIDAKNYVNYRYDRGDDERRAEGGDHRVQSLTYGFWPRNDTRIKLELADHRIQTESRDRFKVWSLWIGYIF